jgi:hypothetical protein
MKGCGLTFVFRDSAEKHYAKRHPGGIYWQNGDISVSVGNPDDGPYLVACDRHSQCTNLFNLSEAKRLVTSDFCEVCSGSLDWCKTCDMDANVIHCVPEGHDVIDDSVQWREMVAAAESGVH